MLNLSDLPRDMKQEILLHIAPKDMLAVMMTCKEFKSILEEDFFLFKKLLIDFDIYFSPKTKEIVSPKYEYAYFFKSKFSPKQPDTYPMAPYGYCGGYV